MDFFLPFKRFFPIVGTFKKASNEFHSIEWYAFETKLIDEHLEPFLINDVFASKFSPSFFE